MAELQALADAMVRDPQTAAVIAGAVVAVVVQVAKRLWGLAGGSAKWQKMGVALVTSVVMTWARRELSSTAGGMGDFAVQTLVTWATSTLTHSAVFRGNGTKCPESAEQNATGDTN